MEPAKVLESLQAVASQQDFLVRTYELARAWANEPDGFEVVEPVLRFMERNPELDFGAPGPLVSFVERFYRHGY